MDLVLTFVSHSYICYNKRIRFHKRKIPLQNLRRKNVTQEILSSPEVSSLHPWRDVISPDFVLRLMDVSTFCKIPIWS